jgi:hypothetical protein
MAIVKWRSTEQLTKPESPNLFRARYDGKCANCPTEIAKGDYIGFNSKRRAICSDCVDEGGSATPKDANEDPEEIVIPTKLVMPRGRTAADLCTKCFLIHCPTQIDCE